MFTSLIGATILLSTFAAALPRPADSALGAEVAVSAVDGVVKTDTVELARSVKLLIILWFASNIIVSVNLPLKPLPRRPIPLLPTLLRRPRGTRHPATTRPRIHRRIRLAMTPPRTPLAMGPPRTPPAMTRAVVMTLTTRTPKLMTLPPLPRLRGQLPLLPLNPTRLLRMDREAITGTRAATMTVFNVCLANLPPISY